MIQFSLSFVLFFPKKMLVLNYVANASPEHFPYIDYTAGEECHKKKRWHRWWILLLCEDTVYLLNHVCN